ncbi:MAG: hypothetical protein AAF533_00975 [Acidobacteriota bacterium]
MQGDARSFLPLNPFKVIDGLRIDPIVRVPTQTGFYREGSTATTIASALQGGGGLRLGAARWLG